MSEISIIPGIAPPSAVPKAVSEKKDSDGAFLKTLQNALAEVSEMQKAADASIMNAEKGTAGIQETLIAVEKADITFRMVMQVRNKVLEAYKEVMRMNV